MPRPARRSRSLKRVKRKAPSGDVRIAYKRVRPSLAKCAECRKPLAGTVRARPAKAGMAKTSKRPTRLYGGYLCAGCAKQKVKAERLYKFVSVPKA